MLLSVAVFAQSSAPQWATMTPQQQEFLLEGLGVPNDQRATFNSSVPNEIKQGLLDSLWAILTPEKRVQVLLYAHLEKPFSETSNQTAEVQAPEWNRLSKFQKAKAYEALKWDGNQRALWEATIPELRQAAFNTLWGYLSPADRKAILSKQ